MILMTIHNDGYIQFEGVEQDITDEIAIFLDEEPKLVKETTEMLIDMGLIEVVQDDYFLPEAKSGIDSECASAERVRKHRNRKTLQCNNDVTDSNAKVTEMKHPCNAEKSREEKSREREEKDIEKEKDPHFQTTISNNSEQLHSPQQIIDLFNQICKSYEPVNNMMEYSKVLSESIIQGFTISDYKTAFYKAENSDYLKGVEGKDYQSNFDWIIAPDNMQNIIKGRYDNK